STNGRDENVLHLHRLDNRNPLPFVEKRAFFHEDFHHTAVNWRTNVPSAVAFVRGTDVINRPGDLCLPQVMEYEHALSIVDGLSVDLIALDWTRLARQRDAWTASVPQDLDGGFLAFHHDVERMATRLAQLECVESRPRRMRFGRKPPALRLQLPLPLPDERDDAISHGRGIGALRCQAAKLPADESGVDLSRTKRGMRKQSVQECSVRLHAGHHRLLQSARQSLDGPGTIWSKRDQLGDHRVIERRNDRARFHPRI